MSKLDNLRNELNAAREKLNAKCLHFDGNINDYNELMKIKPFEIAYQDAIERVWPDSAWWQVTGYWDIFDAMMSGIDDKAIIDEICNHVGKDYLIESANDVVNGACVEFNHNIKEYMSKFGDAYDNGDLWDFSKEDFENGAIDPRDDITYWYMRDLNGDWRYFETNIKCEKEEKKLDEGTSNFGRGPEHFPLLVFYTIDEFYWNMHHNPDYPQEEQFENEDGEIDWDAFEDAKDAFEQKYRDEEKVCILDEDEQERLKDKLYDFNEETKRMAWDADVVDGEQQYGYNLNLEDVMLDIEPGYYEAAYINIEHEDYLDDLEDDFREQQIERFTKFFQELKEEFGLTPLGVAWGPASNGETGYKILNDDLDEKKDKKVKVRFCGDPAREAEFFNHTMGSDDASETSSVSLGEDSSKQNLKPEARNHYKKHCCKEDTIKESFEEIYIKYWEDEDLRDQGISEIYTDNFATREEAIETARKLVDRDGFASVEVYVSPSGEIESEDDKLIWGYDGIDTWGLGKKDKAESLDESRGKGFVCKYKGYNIIDAGDRYVITNKNGLNVGESKFGLPVVKGIIDDFDDVEESLEESKTIETEDGDEIDLFDTYEEAYKYLEDYAKENNIKYYDIVEDNYEVPNGLLFIEYKDKKQEHEKSHYPLVAYKTKKNESLKEGADDVYSLHVKVLDTHSGRPIKIDRIMVGSRKECMDKKKQLEETSPEDSYHNRNVYTVSKVK